MNPHSAAYEKRIVELEKELKNYKKDAVGQKLYINCLKEDREQFKLQRDGWRARFEKQRQ